MLKQVTSGLLLALIFCTGAKMATADDLSAERDKMKMVLNVVSKEVAKNFYDADMKGLDWKALTDQAKQKIENAQSVTDMMRAIFILVVCWSDRQDRGETSDCPRSPQQWWRCPGHAERICGQLRK